MFIESLTKEDIENFAMNKLNSNLAEINKSEDRIYARLRREGYGPSPELVLQDFTCKGINNSVSSHMEDYLEYSWHKFMLDKFGETYKQEYNSFLQKRYEEKILK